MKLIYAIFFTEIIGNKIKDPRIVHQIWVVLRWKVWDKFCILDWNWWKTHIETTWFSKKEIEIKILKKEVHENKDKTIRLFQWLPKMKSKWEFILQKWTELWVTEFIPISSDFSQAKYPINIERDMMIIKEAAEQSERLFLPKLSFRTSILRSFTAKDEWCGIHSFEEIFSSLRGGIAVKQADVAIQIPHLSKFYFFDSEDTKLPTQFDILDSISWEKEINLIIWPEWWFSEKEREIAKKHCKFLSLGKNVLRLETAVIVALARIRD